VNNSIVVNVDVLGGKEEDMQLGLDISGRGEEQSFGLHSYVSSAMMGKVVDCHPNVKGAGHHIATNTLH